MKQFIIYIGTLMVLWLGGISITNYVVDPAHVYSSEYVDKIIEGIKSGYNVEGRSNMNERLYKLKLVECYNGKAFNYLALGSSRIMTVSQESLNGKSLLNLGVSGCKIEDIMALLQICEDNCINYENVIIAVDPTLFNEHDDDNRWKSIESYYDKFSEGKSKGWNGWYIIKNLFSPSYFQASIAAIRNKTNNNNELKYVTTYINDGFTNRTDGSIYYDKKYREMSQADVDRKATCEMHSSFKGFNSVSQERIKLFKKIISYLNNRGVNILFFECPYHPSFYSRIISMEGVKDAIYFIKNYSYENGIEIIGSFNPEDVGFTNATFHDGSHVKKESIDKLFHTFLVP